MSSLALATVLPCIILTLTSYYFLGASMMTAFVMGLTFFVSVYIIIFLLDLMRSDYENQYSRLNKMINEKYERLEKKNEYLEKLISQLEKDKNK